MSSTSQYKRLDHFNELVDYLAATHACSITEESIVAINAKMVELDIKPTALTFNNMSDILRSIGLSKYLEDIPYLMQKLGGYEPPVFLQELRERLQTMFKAVSLTNTAARGHVCPMNNNYVLLKLLQILNETNLMYMCMQHIPLLNQNAKWVAHDEMWHDVCITNDWPFYGDTATTINSNSQK